VSVPVSLLMSVPCHYQFALQARDAGHRPAHCPCRQVDSWWVCVSITMQKWNSLQVMQVHYTDAVGA